MRKIRRGTPQQTPAFWWAFTKPSESPIIVQSDDDRYPVIAAMPFRGSAAYNEPDSAQAAIERAEALIRLLNEGRADYRRVAAAASLEAIRGT